jgi:hypothetical protein
MKKAKAGRDFTRGLIVDLAIDEEKVLPGLGGASTAFESLKTLGIGWMKGLKDT